VNIILLDEQDDPLPPEPLVRLAEIVMAGEGLPADTAVAITLVDAERIAELNSAHMAKTGPTDVLSFPIEDLVPGVPATREPDGPPVDLGDVLICPSVVRANADASGVEFDDEMSLMVVHGLLHLLGYDHVVDDEAERMESRERLHLAEVGRTRP
jgi:probable rRNA maturation factor